MAIDVVCRAVPGGLMCANNPEASKIEHITGREVMVSIKQARNLKFHKKYFALLKTALEMSDLECNAEQFRHLVLCGSGWCTWHSFNGNLIPIPRSIAFASMEDAEFSKLYSDSLDFICANYVDDSPEALDRILQFI